MKHVYVMHLGKKKSQQQRSVVFDRRHFLAVGEEGQAEILILILQLDSSRLTSVLPRCLPGPAELRAKCRRLPTGPGAFQLPAAAAGFTSTHTLEEEQEIPTGEPRTYF